MLHRWLLQGILMEAALQLLAGKDNFIYSDCFSTCGLRNELRLHPLVRFPPAVYS